MKRLSTTILATTVAVLFAVGALMPMEADAFLIRLAAHFNAFTAEKVTALASGGLAGGLLVYSTSVFAPASGVLYVTMYTTGDQHGGARQDFTCIIDGAFCNAGGGPAGGAPAGWVALQRTPAGTGATNCNQGGGGDGDCHDNSITYMWCRRVTAGTHTIRVRMGTSIAGRNVFIEKAHWTVDFSSSSLGSPATCTTGAPAPAAATAPAQ